MRCALLPLSIHCIEGWAYLYYLAGSLVVPATSTTSGNLVPFALQVTLWLPSLACDEQFPDLSGSLPVQPASVCPVLFQASPSATLVHDRSTAPPQSARACADSRSALQPTTHSTSLDIYPTYLPTTANEQTHICPNRNYPPLR